jgi:ATP-dependent DNA helicase RecQ
MGSAAERSEGRRPEAGGSNAATEETIPVDRTGQEELFACLKSLRVRLARQRDVPPYIIFSDKTLRAIARSRPTDPAALLRCTGVGERKLEAYGEAFLKAIREFCRTGECAGE